MFKSSLNLSTELREQYLVKASIHLLLESLELSDTLFKKSLKLLKASKFIAQLLRFEHFDLIQRSLL